MSKTLQGRRVYKEKDEFPGFPGDYRKEPDGTWLLCVPTRIP